MGDKLQALYRGRFAVNERSLLRDMKLDGEEPKPDGEEPKPDGFAARLVKYIPTEVVAGYVATTGIMDSLITGNAKKFGLEPVTWAWIAFGAFVLLAVALTWAGTYTKKRGKGSLFHTIAAVIAFSFWACALGGPFRAEFGEQYSAELSSVFLVIVTIGIVAVDQWLDRRAKQSRGSVRTR